MKSVSSRSIRRCLRTTFSARARPVFVSSASLCSPRSIRPSASSRLSISPADARETPSISATRAASVGEPVGHRPVLADREGEEVDRLQVLVDRVSLRRHGGHSTQARTRSDPRLAGEQVDERRRDEDQQQRGRGRPRVRAERRVLPDLGRERLEADRPQEQRRGQLLHRAQEDERGAGEQPAADQRHRDRREHAQRPVAEAARGLLEPRVTACSAELDAGERLREEPHDVREHEQRERLVERRQRSARRRTRATARSRSRAARCRCTRAARARASSAPGSARRGARRGAPRRPRPPRRARTRARTRARPPTRGRSRGRARRRAPTSRRARPAARRGRTRRRARRTRTRASATRPSGIVFGRPRGCRSPDAVAHAASRARLEHEQHRGRARRARARAPRRASGRRASGTGGRSTGSARRTA